jgi:hypothetical protein
MPHKIDEAQPESTSVEALKSWPIQASALFVSLVLASMGMSQSLPDAVRVGRGLGLVVFAVLLATLVLVWKRPLRGLISVLTLVITAPVVAMNSNDGATSSLQLSQDIHSCYQRAVAALSPDFGDAALSPLDKQQRAYGYVNECLLVQGWSAEDRSAVMYRP